MQAGLATAQEELAKRSVCGVQTQGHASQKGLAGDTRGNIETVGCVHPTQGQWIVCSSADGWISAIGISYAR